jgi:hypothetical protein
LPDIFLSLIGVYGTYIGFNFGFLLLLEFGILENFYIKDALSKPISEVDYETLHLMTLKGISKAYCRYLVEFKEIKGEFSMKLLLFSN